MRRTWMRFGTAAVLGSALAFAVGCGSGSTALPTPNTPKKAAPEKAHDHPHEGPHDGALAEWGEEEYHIEFTVDHKSQEATIYVLDGTAKKALPVDAKELTLTLKLTPPVTITLNAKPETTDAAGKSSRFVGKHAVLGKEQEFTGTISGVVGGKPYSGDFAEEAHNHKH